MHDSTCPPSLPLVLIGGSVRAAAEDAVAAGYHVIALDRFGDRDLRACSLQWHRLDDRHDWLDRIAAWPSAAVVPTGGFSWPPSYRGQHLGQRRKCDPLIAYPPPDVLSALSDPVQLSGLAQRCGIDFPTTVPGAPSADGLPDRLLEPQHSETAPAAGSGFWLVKPRRGCGGVGIRRWQSEVADRSAGEKQPDLQQWVAGRPLGVSYLARVRQGQRTSRLLGACDGLTYRKNRDSPWLYGGSLGPLPLATACREALSQIGDQVATRFDLVGLFNVDFIRRRDGSLVLLEVNPRYSASMELLRDRAGTAVSLIDWHLAAYQEAAGRISTAAADQRMDCHAAANFRKSQPSETNDAPAESSQMSIPTGPELACKRIVYAAAPLRVECSAAELSALVGMYEPAAARFRVSFHDLPASGETIAAGCPAMTVIVRGGNDARALARYSYRVAAQLRQRLR